MLAAAAPDLRLTSVVLCGIIVAGLGVLNDVTITQASAVWELADADRRQGGRQSLFSTGDADRPRPHRVDRLHDRLRDRRRVALGPAADRDLRPTAVPGAPDRTVRRRGGPDPRRLDRSGAGGATDHRHRRSRRSRSRTAKPARAPKGATVVRPSANLIDGGPAKLFLAGGCRARFVIRGWKFADRPARPPTRRPPTDGSTSGGDDDATTVLPKQGSRLRRRSRAKDDDYNFSDLRDPD